MIVEIVRESGSDNCLLVRNLLSEGLFRGRDRRTSAAPVARYQLGSDTEEVSQGPGPRGMGKLGASASMGCASAAF